jgi:hypothetical protein
MARALGDQRRTGRGLVTMAGVAFFEQDMAKVERLCDEGIGIARQLGDDQLLGMLLASRSFGLPVGQERDRVRREALACFRRADDQLLISSALHNLYGLSLHAGRLDEGRVYLEESISIAEDLGANLMMYYLRSELAMVLLIEGRHAEAVPLVRRNLLMARRIAGGADVAMDIAMVIFAAACCAAWQGEHLRAARLHGAADADIAAALADSSIGWSDLEQRLREDEQGWLRQRIGDQAFDDAYRLGGELTRLRAVELALGNTPATPGIGSRNIG